MASGGHSTERSKNSLADRKERAAGRNSKSEDDAIREFAGLDNQSMMAPAGGADGPKGAARRRPSGKDQGIAGAHGSSSGPTNVPEIGHSTRPARKRKG
jgi:hypothetical protein